MTRIQRRLLRAGIVILALLLLHRQILLGIGGYLIVEDPLRKVDAIYVLSGNSQDRGRAAAALYQQGYAPEVVCLGGEAHDDLALYGIALLTASMTQKVVLQAGVPDSAIRLLPKGSSTFEEFEAITADCKVRGYQNIMVVSSRFHMRRIHMFFRNRLYFEGIDLVLHGSYESSFDERAWWKKEPGLLFVNNEYIKMAFYWLRY
jgi:uncharacterized SAM-binding protein YcdF (DUF218 family)